MLLKAETVSISSSFPPDAILVHLRARAQSSRESTLTSSERNAGILGWSLKERPGRITLRAQIGGRNSFLPHFVGTIHTTPGGSQLDGELRLSWFPRLFMVVWLSAVGSGPILALLGPMPDASLGEHVFAAIFMLLPCGALFAAGIWIAEWSSKKPTVAIKDLLHDATNGARQAPSLESAAPGI